MHKGKLFLTSGLVLIALAVLPSTALALLPETTLTGGPAEGSYIPGPTATFTFTGAGAPGNSFKCTVDGGAEQNCSSPFTTAPLANGPHTFSVYFYEMGTINRDPTPEVRNFNVGPAPVPLGKQLPVQILTTKAKANKKGKFEFQVSCPATSPVSCTGTIALTPANPASIPFVIAAGQTVTYTAKAGKTGKAKALIAKQGSSGRTKRVAVTVTQPDAGVAKASVTLKYSAKQGKTGSAK